MITRKLLFLFPVKSFQELDDMPCVMFLFLCDGCQTLGVRPSIPAHNKHILIAGQSKHR
jgi:hypothetical protein